MKKRTRKGLITTLCCGILATAAIGVTANVTASADSVRVKPTGTNTATLTAPINDADLDTFKVQGASTRTSEPNGFRFLATIGAEDLALIPNNAEFGMLLVPDRLLGDSELTENTANVLVAPAKIDADEASVPENGLGYRITLMGETLDEAFPQNLYGTVLAARAYVKYTYEANGETVTDYAYSSETLYRSIAYVASCELADLEEKGVADTNAESFLNKIIADQTQYAVLTLSETSIKVGETATVELENATDGRNAFEYVLTSSNETVATIENGEIVANGVGTTEITASIGAKKFSATLTVEGAVAFDSGNILYSTKDGTIFMPDGLLDEGETIVSAIDTNGEDYFNKGKWTAMALTDAEITANTARETTLTVETSDGDLYTVKAISYAGIIDELSDFPTFFNNDASAVAPNVYGYYIVTKNLGTGSEELALTQTTQTDYSATNGFNGVLDGAGHTLKFKLTSGSLVGMILGNAVIKNLSVIFEDATSTHYGVFGYLTNGAPEIRNCYIQQTNNHAQRTTFWGIMARPNGKLRLHNTVVFGNNIAFDTTWSTPAMNVNSSNAFIIWARANASSFAIAANFTEISTSGALTSDLSVLDSNYWTTTDNKPNWKTAADTGVSVYDAKYVEVVEEKAYYSTLDGEFMMPDGVLAGGETIVNAYDTNGVDYYEDGVWSNLAVSTTSNETKETTLIIETSNGDFYQLTVSSYAGVIDEATDFATFFNNDTTANAPKVYGNYVVIKDIGSADAFAEVAVTCSTTTDYSATCGFNGRLDGQGHTLYLNLTSGGLVGMILGNAVIENLGIIFEDTTSTGYGIFGYMTNGEPEIRNCYIEQTNNHYKKTTVYGLIARANGKLRLHNTVVYGFNFSQDNTSWSNVNLNENSNNAYVIHARNGATGFAISTNFTKVFTDGIENGSRDVLLSEIADASGFDNNYWYKENGKLIWKGLDVVNITWVNGETTTVEPFTKGHIMQFPALEDAYWSKTENGGAVTMNGAIAEEDCTYYAVSTNRYVDEKAYYSTVNNEFILPTAITESISGFETVTSADGATVYYENGEWYRNFALTSAQITANETTETEIKIYDGKNNYFVTVHSYAGVIDELSDFPTFFNNEATAAGKAPATYGHYVIIKNIGSLTDDLAMTQCAETDYTATCGFNGIVDGLGHKVQFNLTSGALFGMILGNCTIQNLAVVYNDNTAGDFGAFGYMTNGTPKIVNCYIAKQNNRYQKGTTYGIMARPNSGLVLKNTVVFGSNVTMDNSSYANTATISKNSTNAFVIWGRATNTTINTNFTEVSTNGAITSDLNVLDSTYWTTTDNKPSWKTADDAEVTSVGTIEQLAMKKLAENGVTEYSIIMPDNASADPNMQFAQQELINFFEEATGATLSVAEDGQYSTYDAYISIGYTEMYKASGLSLGAITGQGYHIQTKNNAIFINSSGTLGCVYGVYGLLNKLFGYEQFSMDCYTLNGATTVEVPELDHLDIPDFEIRNPVSGSVTADDTYAMRMRMANTRYILPVGDTVNNGGYWRENHNVLEILPPAYWKESEPNWYADSGLQLCYTAHGNETDYKEMVAQIAKIFCEITIKNEGALAKATNPEAKYIVLSSEDGNGVCTCSACTTAKQTYGSNTGAVIKMCNDIRESIETWMTGNEKYRRDITLLFLAYNDYYSAPVTLNTSTGTYELNGGLTMRSDVGVYFAGSSDAHYYQDFNGTYNADFKTELKKWSDVTNASGSPLWLWTYSLNNNEYMIHADMYGAGKFYNESAYQYFKEMGVDFYYNQGPWNATTTVSAFNRLNIYLDSQLMWDSTQSVATLTDKYFTAMYGAGASYMKQLYDAENAASRELFDPYIEGVPNDQTDSFESWFGVLSSSSINTWLGYITSAKNAVNADTTLTDAQKTAYIDHINEEWIAVKYWQMRYHGSSIKAAAKAEFREVLGYDEATSTYAKDVTLGERYDYTLVQWVENNFSEP